MVGRDISAHVVKAINFLINSFLPETLQDYDRVYDKKGISDLMALLARHHPEKYREISKKISDTGRMASYLQGETLTLADMKTPIDKAAIFDQMDAELAKVLKSTPPKERKAARFKVYMKYSSILRGYATKAMLAGQHGLATLFIQELRVILIN